LRREEQDRQVEDDLESLGLSSARTAAAKLKAPPLLPLDLDKQQHDSDDEGARRRLDAMGFKAGWAAAERCAVVSSRRSSGKLTLSFPHISSSYLPLAPHQPRERPPSLPNHSGYRLSCLSVTLSRASSTPSRCTRARQVSLQRVVDRRIRQAGRQPPYQSPRRLGAPRQQLASIEGAESLGGGGQGRGTGSSKVDQLCTSPFPTSSMSSSASAHQAFHKMAFQQLVSRRPKC
jgi:hypothetical protein